MALAPHENGPMAEEPTPYECPVCGGTPGRDCPYRCTVHPTPKEL